MSASATQGGHNKCSAVAEMGDRFATIHMAAVYHSANLWGPGTMDSLQLQAYNEMYRIDTFCDDKIFAFSFLGIS